MRGPSKSLPKYRKHKATGQAIVTLSGTDHYLGPHGTKASKREYDGLVGEWLANDRRPTKTINEPSITIVELCAAYWRQTDRVGAVGALKENSALGQADCV